MFARVIYNMHKRTGRSFSDAHNDQFYGVGLDIGQ